MVLLTGSSGFVGTALIRSDNFGKILRYKRGNKISLEGISTIIHLAGKAHDLKNASDASEYYLANTELTKRLFDEFLLSDTKVFITLSSVKAAADSVEGELVEIEPHLCMPKTHYGKSKLLAEEYIISHELPQDKRVFILRPCMIYGKGNKGNLNALYMFISKGLPWPLGGFENKRSFCSIENLLFVIRELITRDNIPSGIYNIADEEPLSTNDLVKLIAKSLEKKIKIVKIPYQLVKFIAIVGDIFKLPINSERLQKLTDSYVVSNQKLVKALGKPLPVSSRSGILRAFSSF